MTREAKLRGHREFQRKVDVADLHYLAESGFVARGDTGPQQDAPQNWVVWHFTHKDNLQGIVDDNGLLPSTMKAPAVNVANTGIKGRRATIRVRPDGTYPEATVAQHVPFYIAAKSPMLYSISKGHEEYRGGTADLVFLGAALGDIAASGLTWCVSNGNAAAAFTEFSRQLPTLGSFVDFPLLQQRIWKNVPEDMNRMKAGRGAAGPGPGAAQPDQYGGGEDRTRRDTRPGSDERCRGCATVWRIPRALLLMRRYPT